MTRVQDSPGGLSMSRGSSETQNTYFTLQTAQVCSTHSQQCGNPSAVSLCSVPVKCSSAVSLCSVPVQCPSAVSLCNVPVQIQSDLQLIRLSRGQSPWTNVGLRAQEPNSWVDPVAATLGLEPPTFQVRVIYLSHNPTGCPTVYRMAL